eukprot:CAMPEP_0181250634 /NCGR_PEP_ID=MMETSP1096-20121128/46427_1 /TAXON_ID=156174 ORGANISM="Chrysochromulina ericina, Strain CCMP281" /NCGR_SAMPLE_ID=MMETSP1096 /ASSEMBLY_ACC=CAM_ASM_000453 /LENGTH=34 /DNA_ID= /DNA_START= /DNA_END= /DNA_ORIENTATION=
MGGDGGTVEGSDGTVEERVGKRKLRPSRDEWQLM